VSRFLISIAQIHGQTQAEMNAVSRSDFARADADLNKLINRFWQKLGDPESKQKLKETQRAWVTSMMQCLSKATSPMLIFR